MQHKQTAKTYSAHFTSLGEAQRYIDTTPKVWRATHSVTNPADRSWDLGEGMEGALKLAREGWREGGKAMAQGLVKLPAIDSTPDWKNDVAGYLPDVGRYCAGLPDCMIAPDDTSEGNKPIVTLAVNIGANCGTKAQAMRNYGLAIARYVDELEAAGTRVELLAVTASDVNGVRCSYQWTVKEAGEPMNLETVSFSIGHPAAYRRIWFALMERLPNWIVECGGYGYPTDAKLEDLLNPSAGTIVLNGMTYANTHSMTEASALAYVSAQIDLAMTTPDASAH